LQFLIRNLALATQKADFIKVYPVPFKEQLYIGFELANPAQINVSLTSTATAQTIAVANASLPAGAPSWREQKYAQRLVRASRSCPQSKSTTKLQP
jgi:hypothetical protein